jgi:LytR cell envelope-related transcriptional attenuator
METSLTPVETLVRPWRTATLVAVGVAVVEAALVIALVVTLLSSADGNAATTAAKAAPTTKLAAAKPAKPKILPRTRTSILILNGNGRTGAAAAEADVVRSLRYKVAAVGNAGRSDYGRSAVLYTAGHVKEARRLARDLGITIVGPLDGISPRRMGHATAAIILGR